VALSTALRRVSQSLISKNGTSAVLVHRPSGISDGTYDTFNVTTGLDPSAELKEPVSVIIEAARSGSIAPPAAGVTQAQALTNVRSATLAAKGLVQPPTERDELKMGTDTWLVLEVREVEHEGLPILYKLTIRR